MVRVTESLGICKVSQVQTGKQALLIHRNHTWPGVREGSVSNPSSSDAHLQEQQVPLFHLELTHCPPALRLNCRFGQWLTVTPGSL